jgi:membrane protein YqaA with SNARE-associated domain
VHGFVSLIIAWLLKMGIFGPLILGIADSSFLFFPFGNDLLLVVLTARSHAHMPFYVMTAAIGSTVGVLLLDLVARKGGEEGLKRMMKPTRFEYFKKRMSTKAGVAVAIASISPPPFPFTVAIASASAFQYPRSKLLTIVLGMRAIRFTIVGLLAIHFGPSILKIAKAPQTLWFMLGFIALCVAGSAYQVVQWMRRSRRPVAVGS